MRTKTLIFYCFICLASCSSLDRNGYENLGAHYFLWEEDHHIYSIVWSQNKNNGSVGGASVIENVTGYNYSDNYIIVKTTDVSPGAEVIKFWLIDKRKVVDFKKKGWKTEILSGPLDSIEFMNLTRQMKINLKFKPIPKIEAK